MLKIVVSGLLLAAQALQIPNAVVRLSGQAAGLDTSEIEAHLKAVGGCAP